MMLPAVLIIILPVVILAWQQPAPRFIKQRLVLSTAADDTSEFPSFWLDETTRRSNRNAPFGRAQKGVEERLQALYWQQRRQHDQSPSFTFKYPGAPTFCAYHADISGPIRQLPASWDEHIDDKLRLHLLLSTAPQLSGLTPPTFTVDHTLLASLDESSQEIGRWFLKHRLDAKRPRVHPFENSTELGNQLRKMGEDSWRYFIAQKEISPPMLVHGRKFVLRAHVLASVSPKDNMLRLFLHNDPLVSEHQASFEDASLSALVLQSASSRSAAYLLSETDTMSARYTPILEQMGSTVAAVFQELHKQHPLSLHHHAQHSGEQAALYYQLYGLDFMLDDTGQCFLLEVNRSPRIATGAMGDVHESYMELLIEAMQILGVVTHPKTDAPEFGVWRDITGTQIDTNLV